MDARGYVPLDHVCSFSRLRAICADPAVVRRAVEGSDKLSLIKERGASGGRPAWLVRTNDQPERWVLGAVQP